MKNDYDHTLKEVMEELLKAYKWEEKLDVVKLKKSWDSIVGKIIAKHTTHLDVRNRVLYVKLDSSVIRSELMLARSKIVEAINKEMGYKMVDELALR
jgi:predicted nucleic acid-binding Zn ribbon protein